MREGRASLITDVNGGSGSGRQLAMTGDEVGVEMSLENVTNLNLVRLGGLEVNIDVPLWIDDHRLALRGQQVRGMRQTT
jgi:hypothetical protein